MYIHEVTYRVNMCWLKKGTIERETGEKNYRKLFLGKIRAGVMWVRKIVSFIDFSNCFQTLWIAHIEIYLLRFFEDISFLENFNREYRIDP